MALAVVQTSQASFGGPQAGFLRRTGPDGPRSKVEAVSMTFEVALHGPTLNALRRVAQRHHLSLEEALAAAVDDWINLDANSHLWTPTELAH